MSVNAVNGVAANTASNINGVTTPSAINGQTLASASLSVSDPFNRVENPLVGVTGCLWTNLAAGSYVGMKATGAAATGTTASTNCGAFVTTPSFASFANQKATITYNGFTNVGAFVRLDSSCNGYRVHIVSSTSVQVNKITAGTASQLGSNLTITGISVGDTIGIGIVGTGANNITIYRNGVAQGTTFSDSTFTAGAPGIFDFGSTGTLTTFTAVSL